MVYKFDAVLVSYSEMEATYIDFPYEIEKEFKTSGHVNVKVLFDGIPYQGVLVNVGSVNHSIIVTKAIRTLIQKQKGDTVSVELEEDFEPRVVTVPEDLAVMLENYPDAGQFFTNLAYPFQKEYVDWIEASKKESTRTERLFRVLENLKKRNKKLR